MYTSIVLFLDAAVNGGRRPFLQDPNEDARDAKDGT